MELHGTNEQLAVRTAEADRTSAFLRSILASVHTGLVVVDAELKVLLWNDQAEDLWGLRASEANGQGLAALDIGLPVELLAERVHAFLAGKTTESELTFAATNRRGKAIQCRITCTLRPDAENAPPGVVLMMEETKP